MYSDIKSFDEFLEYLSLSSKILAKTMDISKFRKYFQFEFTYLTLGNLRSVFGYLIVYRRVHFRQYFLLTAL